MGKPVRGGFREAKGRQEVGAPSLSFVVVARLGLLTDPLPFYPVLFRSEAASRHSNDDTLNILGCPMLLP